jgi:hypothetical protein
VWIQKERSGGLSSSTGTKNFQTTTNEKKNNPAARASVSPARGRSPWLGPDLGLVGRPNGFERLARSLFLLPFPFMIALFPLRQGNKDQPLDPLCEYVYWRARATRADGRVVLGEKGTIEYPRALADQRTSGPRN